MIEVQPPKGILGHYNTWPRIFLAGSIELDSADRWQDRLLGDLWHYDFVALNPRRSDWDNSIEQSIEDPRFVEQVNWELDNIEESDLIVFYFDPNTKSPITLMELGIVSQMLDGPVDVIVCCPPGFWRRGNVEVVCARNGIMLVDNYDSFVNQIEEWLKGVDY